MKKMTISILLIPLILSSLLILITLLRVPISKGKILKPLSIWVQLFCPPKDLYEPVFIKEIDIAKTDANLMDKFTIKYPGRYTVGILLSKPLEEELYKNEYDLKLRLKSEFYRDKSLLISKESTGDYCPFYGKKDDGLMLLEFRSPEEIPIDTEIFFKTKVLSADRDLNKKYEPIRLYIQKMSEL